MATNDRSQRGYDQFFRPSLESAPKRMASRSSTSNVRMKINSSISVHLSAAIPFATCGRENLVILATADRAKRRARSGRNRVCNEVLKSLVSLNIRPDMTREERPQPLDTIHDRGIVGAGVIEPDVVLAGAIGKE